MHAVSVFLYNIGIWWYGTTICVLAPFYAKARRWVTGRRGLWTKLEQSCRTLRKKDQPVVWFHCASLGEFEQARPVIEQFKKHSNGIQIVLSFFSPSGYEIRKDYNAADIVTYLPLDTHRHARRFIALLRPDAAVFVKYEFWYHYLQTLAQQQLPVFLISAVFRSGQPFFRWYGSLHREMLRIFTCVLVQDASSLHRLERLTGVRAVLSGDTRVDRVMAIKQEAAPEPMVERFKGKRLLVVGGSVYAKEADFLGRFSRAYTGHEVCYLVAPHEVGEAGLRAVERHLDQVQRFSEVQRTGQVDTEAVLVIDSVGMLARLYRYADVAVIGGGFGAGIHNTLEPAAFGVPSLFGPRYKKFNEARDLLARGGAFTFSNYPCMEAALKKLLADESHRESAAAAARKYIRHHAGVSQQVAEAILTQMARLHGMPRDAHTMWV